MTDLSIDQELDMGNRLDKQKMEHDEGGHLEVFYIFLGICFCVILIWRIYRNSLADSNRARSYSGSRSIRPVYGRDGRGVHRLLRFQESRDR